MISSRTLNAFLIGSLIGIAIYSAAKNGFGFPTFFALFLAFLALGGRKKAKGTEKEPDPSDSV